MCPMFERINEERTSVKKYNMKKLHVEINQVLGFRRRFNVPYKWFRIITDWDGFILDEHQLIPTASETWAGVRVVADAVIERTKQYQFGDGSAGSCYDLRHACKRWIQENESLCRTVPIFMREQCAYSCGHC
uniref:ShKT domain-containing protein n=1 Tax=Parascaris equorum TaxID=6256 RepID=A0A914RHS5_PAREQ